MELLGYEGHVEPQFGLLETVSLSVQDRCTVCTEHTTGSEIVLDAPMELLGHVGVVEPCFGPF
jgi:hypothetical protein